jgi:prepilin-type processing-associated H-X9-DG protein
MVIIGILAAIIFPVITKAKESARIGQCLSNLRQLGAGLILYTDSYDTRFPAAAPWGNPNYWRQSRFGSQKTIQELLKPYVRNGMEAEESRQYKRASAFVCPSDTGVPASRWIYGCDPNQPIWRYAGCSYEYYASNQQEWEPDSEEPDSGSWYVRSWTGLSPEVRSAYGYQRIGAPMAKILSPTRKAVLGDMWYWHMGDKAPNYDSSESAYQGRLAFRNTLFADGHAARVNGLDHQQARVQPLSPLWHTLSEVPDE